MCADSMVSTGDTWWPCNKITEINDCLVGCAGEADQGKKFLKWFADQSQSKPKLTDAFCALVLTKTELHYYCSTLIPETIERGFHAVGSGGPIALGAMLAGKDLTTAVRIASQVDTFTREPIHYVILKNANSSSE